MGSLEEFKNMVKFVDEHQIRPVVHTLLDGLEHAEDGFEIMKNGHQFGKVSDDDLRIVDRPALSIRWA